MNAPLSQRLTAFGAATSEIRSLVAEDPATIDYLDLQRFRRMASREGNAFVAPDAVVLVNGQPLLYAVYAESLSSTSDANASLVTLRSALACRGESSYLAVVSPGEIKLVSAHYAPDLKDAVVVKHSDALASFLIRDLAAGIKPGAIAEKAWQKATRDGDKRAVHELLFSLLDHVTKALRSSGPLQGRDEEILSLVGRALFTCFLLDRGILSADTCPALFGTDGVTAFSNPRSAALCCDWLDETFNGELLPIECDDYASYFNALNGADGLVFRELSKIIERTTAEGQRFLDCSWIDFSHVPADLLSQLYESYAHKFFGDDAGQESIHYTPRYIAEYMMEQAFPGIETAKLDKARVLDPAAGACIFLVLSLRRLVQERWLRTRRRPRTKEIRQILNEQLRGYDINSHALKLGALSLYLTALELDPNPLSGDSLVFEPLMDHVLFNTRLPDEQYPCSLVLGSLCAELPDDPMGNRYDLVISNPPWTPWRAQKNDSKSQARADALNGRASEMIRKIAKERSPLLADVTQTHENALKAPDVPFIWRSMEWAKPGAVIAYAVHARLLFRRADAGASTRDALFRALRITGIFNGTALRMEEVWPNVEAPFCLVFARNSMPSDTDHFYYVSPEVERGLNRRSLWRTDYQSAHPIEMRVLKEKPYLLKTLFRGTALDVELIDRLESQLTAEELKLGQDGGRSIVPSQTTKVRTVRLASYWSQDRGLFSGQGFMGPGTQKADFIREMNAKTLSAKDDAGRYVETSKLKLFAMDRVERPRRPEIYRTPLVLFSQTPGARKTSHPVRITLDPTPVAFNYSYYGYSTAGHAQPAELACYLFVIANSDLFSYYTLMTSARFGVERDTIYVEDVDVFPMRPFEDLTKREISEACKLAKDFCVEDPEGDAVRRQINRWVGQLYGLSADDIQLVEDTLAVSSPLSTSKDLAQSVPTRAQITTFAKRLEAELAPFFDDENDPICVTPQPVASQSWLFVSVHTHGAEGEVQGQERLKKALTILADHEGSSRVLMNIGQGHLCIGMLAQYRYWTPSRARATALSILQSTDGVFGRNADIAGSEA
ncbi:class I SAM-dependent DNA methyltransferase [Variovorax sp. PAMC26660]|uniref:HsdM family class I SAM-dependent methyltransferase n=1 Tax=Variovorax sp. PAMC26660 TaxID=2762322 RepID=UPI00164E80B0|nr:N-6 DNA methylase [Variovorax sp. PAMC26660]QNK65804.1 N-6 DNA methylase [Variovorax sp. PAMC26660]